MARRQVPRFASADWLGGGPAERGDEEERNQANSREIDQNRQAKESEEIMDGEGGRVRSELARDLVKRVDQLLLLVGDVSLATHIGLLKHDLSRCHDALKPPLSETNYLSIVTLVEAAMAQLKWKQYDSPPARDDSTRLLDIGYRQVLGPIQGL